MLDKLNNQLSALANISICNYKMCVVSSTISYNKISKKIYILKFAIRDTSEQSKLFYFKKSLHTVLHQFFVE